MAEIVLFHHVQGSTPGVVDLAHRFRRAGHVVHTPDLFEGARFDTIEAGLANLGAIGFDVMLERAWAGVADLPAALVYIGISMGAMPAQALAQTRPGAMAAVLLESCAPASAFGGGWPRSVPVQVHGAAGDPFFAGEGDIDVARELVASADDGELFVYEGEQHLFTDSSLPSFDEVAAASVVERVLTLLDRIDPALVG